MGVIEEFPSLTTTAKKSGTIFNAEPVLSAINSISEAKKSQFQNIATHAAWLTTAIGGLETLSTGKQAQGDQARALQKIGTHIAVIQGVLATMSPHAKSSHLLHLDKFTQFCKEAMDSSLTEPDPDTYSAAPHVKLESVVELRKTGAFTKSRKLEASKLYQLLKKLGKNGAISTRVSHLQTMATAFADLTNKNCEITDFQQASIKYHALDATHGHVQFLYGYVMTKQDLSTEDKSTMIQFYKEMQALLPYLSFLKHQEEAEHQTRADGLKTKYNESATEREQRLAKLAQLQNQHDKANVGHGSNGSGSAQSSNAENHAPGIGAANQYALSPKIGSGVDTRARGHSDLPPKKPLAGHVPQWTRVRRSATTGH